MISILIDDMDKSIRDVLYGFIPISKTELKIIDMPMFRRLQSIKQLSHAYLAYPSAVHTRFEHLLGTMHVAGMMAEGLKMDDDKVRAVRMASLLHDIGHGPFSHLFEDIMGILNPNVSDVHEKISGIMIREDKELSNLLGKYRDPVLEILGHSKRTKLTSPLESEIISGSLDADKIDYLRRDSYHTGVKYGEFDFERVIRNIDSEDSRLCMGIKGKYAVESFRLARYLMHAQVYGHHARLAADRMFVKALKIALDNGAFDADRLKLKSDGNNGNFLSYYGQLNDYSIYEMIIKSEKSGAHVDILRDIQRRNLLKRACDFIPEELEKSAILKQKLVRMNQKEYEDMSARISQAASVPEHQVIFYRSRINNKAYGNDPTYISDPILHKISKGNVVYLDDVSPFKGKEFSDRFLVFGPPDAESIKKVAEATAAELDIDVGMISHRPN
ncbi:MAG: HD domain-containing protein [Alphaproteobacteria bacterium]|nr:HD domain-containing protein [Alphaproteobacteria bacterium]